MSGVTIRGIEEQHEHAALMVARDTRPLGVRFAQFVTNPVVILTVFFASISMSWITPQYADILLVICGILTSFVLTRKQTLPVKLPESSKALDHNDPIPGGLAPNKSSGIAYFGNDRVSREEIWFSNSDMRTHVLIFGSTGSGKTEALISLAFNALVNGSGFIYVDGKGDNSLYSKVASMTHKMGRIDDLLVINFMTGARDVVGPQPNRLSNTMNPFANGSSSMLSQLVISLMDGASGDPSGDMWKGRAINFVESLMKILTVMRDNGHILLDANTIRDYFLLPRLESIVVDKKFPVGDTGILIPIDNYPSQILDPLKNYVLNLPGYNPSKKGNQSGEVLEQHGFITMQLTRVFGSLADTYGHILRTNLAEVDLKDVVLNRRILVVLLPALEKSPEELSNLGKIIIASLKAMMAAGLGDAIEGDYRDVISRKPTNSPSPFVCIMDEYGYYAVKGFAVVAAQARSLGFCAIFAGQDLPAFQKASKEEAASIGANCNIKICMKLEDPQETWEFFNKAAGETYVTNVSSFQMNPGSLAMNYMDSRNTSVDRRQRIELLDLKDQREGEAHIFFKSKIIRVEMFYANPKAIKKLRLASMLKVATPPASDLEELNSRLARANSIFRMQNPKIPRVSPNEDIDILANAFNEAYGLRPMERGFAGLINILEHDVATQRSSNNYIHEIQDDSMSIFSPIQITDTVERMIGPNNTQTFSMPLVRGDTLIKDLESIERLSGKNEADAKLIAQHLISELDNVTKFPNDLPPIKLAQDQILTDLNRLIIQLGGTPHSPEESKADTQSKFDFDSFNPFENMPPLPDMPQFPDLPPLPDLPSLDELEHHIRSLDIKDLGLDNLPDGLNSLKEIDDILATEEAEKSIETKENVEDTIPEEDE